MKGRRYSSRRQTWYKPRGDDILRQLAAAGINAILGPTTTWLEDKTAEMFGMNSSPSPEAAFKEQYQHAQLLKQQAELERSQAQRLRAEAQAKLAELRVLEKQAQLEADKSQGRMVSIQTDVDVSVNTRVTVGSLDITASSGGLAVADDQQNAYRDWLQNLVGLVILILGKRGSGKSAMAAKLGELMQAVYGFPVFWLGIPKTAQPYLPSWVRIVESLAQCPNECFILVDESGLQFLSLEFAGKRNVELRQWLMLTRQRRQTVVFCAHSARDVDESIVRQCNTTIYKEPTQYAPESERPEIRPHAAKAAETFRQITKDERVKVAYIFDHDFEGLVRCSLPTFWSEQLSTAYGAGHVPPPNGDARYRYHEATDADIIDLWRKGYGYESIARRLGCSDYRVRKCLAGRKRVDSEDDAS